MQNNEAEALRSWKSALDQIYYHNAYRVPPHYRPKSETEKALQDSLRDMELQCKERVDLLEALRKSRQEANDGSEKQGNGHSSRGRHAVPKSPKDSSDEGQSGWMGQGTVPVVNYPDLSRQGPPLPHRPVVENRALDTQSQRTPSVPQIDFKPAPAPPTYSPLPPPDPPKLPASSVQPSRTPSPDKRSRMLTTLRSKDGKKPSKSPRDLAGRRNKPPAASKAAGLAWDAVPRPSPGQIPPTVGAQQNPSTVTINSVQLANTGEESAPRSNSASTLLNLEPPSRSSASFAAPQTLASPPIAQGSRPSAHSVASSSSNIPNLRNSTESARDLDGSTHSERPKPLTKPEMRSNNAGQSRPKSPNRPIKQHAELPSYRSEFPVSQSTSQSLAIAATARVSGPRANAGSTTPQRYRSPERKTRPPASSISRRPVANPSSPHLDGHNRGDNGHLISSESNDESTSSSKEKGKAVRSPRKKKTEPMLVDAPSTPPSTDGESPTSSPRTKAWDERVKYIKKHLPKGVDEGAAKQIFNEIVVRGDEVHWADVAGLDVAKKALKEAVVYPFLRPDLFMGLREPARGMLLFGPPGTGKTMLARAVATESKSTFFAISASSLTSKWLGESEKLVRALFALAKALAPSIIFVDEIDSLLSSRGGSSEHESTRRIKTEFLIQWSDLQRAAAGKEQTAKEQKEGDATRVLVLAATNMPWAIDEAARRRFVRRQYIPLPEGHVRAQQIRTLLGHQKHSLNERDIKVLVEVTDGKSIPRTSLYWLDELR